MQRAASGIHGTEIVIVVDGDERQLPMRTEASLLRIAQGALGNVAKHAQAERCHVTLSYGEKEVRLDIVDDGVGFNPELIADVQWAWGISVLMRCVSEPLNRVEKLMLNQALVMARQ